MISSKQDRTGARTVQDLERRINPTRIREDIEAKTRLAIESGLKQAGGDVISYINASADMISLKGKRLELECGDDENNPNFKLTPEGEITAKKGTIGGCEIDEAGNLQITNANIKGKLTADKIDATNLVIDNTRYDNKYSTKIGEGIITVVAPQTEASDYIYVDLLHFQMGNDIYALCARSNSKTDRTPTAIVFRKVYEW